MKLESGQTEDFSLVMILCELANSFLRDAVAMNAIPIEGQQIRAQRKQGGW
jgi:hypothetical protein